MTNACYPPEVDHVNDVVLSNTAALIQTEKYEGLVGYQAYCIELHNDVKFLSEVLTCLHFARPKHPLTAPLVDRIRRIILHPYMLQAVRANPLIGNWLLNAVAVLQNHYVLERERAFAFALIERFGLHSLDAPGYRTEENRYLFAKLKGREYVPAVDQTFERNFYRLSRDQVYALTHLLFYVSDYGTRRYACSTERRFAMEHLIYDAYLNDDIDVMLELMLVHRACEQSDEKSVAVFERLLLKLLAKSPDVCHAMTERASEHFATYYHQALLAVMYGSARSRWNCAWARLDPGTFRVVRGAHGFHRLLCSANYVLAARKFTTLLGLDCPRLGFCRDNLEHYLALQRHDLGVLSVSG